LMPLFHALNWTEAIETLEAVSNLDPNNPEAPIKLRIVRECRKIANLFDDALEFAEAGLWQKALDNFNEIKLIDREYKDVETLIIEVENKLAEKENFNTC
jgi:hypothetical protein